MQQDQDGNWIASNPKTGQWVVHRDGKWQPYSPTPEQRYENFYSNLPKTVQNFMPSTMGQAGFAAGGLGVGTAAVVGAPFSAGATLAIPLLAAIAGGAAGDPKHALSAGSWEGAKSALQEGAGAIASKGIELGSRFAFKNQMLNKMARRIGDALPQLFSRFPMSVPRTAADLEGKIASGDLTEAAGKQLGRFRDNLSQNIPAYIPGSAPKLVNASPGVPFHYTPAIAQSGVKFTLPDIGPDSKIVSRDFSIKDAIDHIRGLQSAGWSVSGTPKSAQEAWLIRETAHDARQALIAQLNQYKPGLGDTYGGLSGDYGTAVHLQKVFKQSYRPDGQLDQPKLLHALRNEIDDIAKMKGPQRAALFHRAIAPDRAEATAEVGVGARVHGGGEGFRAYLHPPVPYKPETRQLIPQPFRALSSKQALPVIGYGIGKGVEDITDTNEEQ